HDALEIVVAQPRREHAAVLRLGEGGPDAHAHRLHAIAVEIELREVFAERLADAVVAVRPRRHLWIDHFALAVETRHMVRAREHDAPDALLASRFVEVVDADDVGLQDRLPRPLDRDTAE